MIIEGHQDTASKFSITGKTFYVTAASFSTKDNTDLLQILNSGLKEKFIGLNNYKKN